MNIYMTNQFNIEHRKPIWAALSAFYLDTELQDSDIHNIAFIIKNSPYSLEEIKAINKYEVFPVLHLNLMSVAGEWAGFDEEWLVDEILSVTKKKSWIRRWWSNMVFNIYKEMFEGYWEKITRL
jgi:hypothetical protein